MGMSASQTRVLMLTARQNDLEYQAQQILQAKLAASRQAEDAAAAYEEKISNTHFVTPHYQNGNEIKKEATPEDIFNSYHYFVNNLGQVVIPDDEVGDALLEEINKNPESFGLTKVDTYDNTRPSYDERTVVRDERLNASERASGAIAYYKEALEKGELSLCRRRTIADNEKEIGHKFTTMDASASFAEVYYTADDAAAEAEYNSITKKLETMEKKLDMQMEQIETERTAIKTEKESVEKVVKENVESTFKTFG